MSIKTEPVDNEEEDDTCTMVGSKACSISLAIDNVVGNYKPSVTIKPKTETTTKSTPKSVAKPTSSKPSGTKTSTALKTTPKSTPKAGLNRPSSAKIASAPKSNAKTVQTNRRLVGDDEEDLDPAMYLDPTITITLINNDEKKTASKNVNDVASASSISSSDLQVLSYILDLMVSYLNCFEFYFIGLKCSWRECFYHCRA